MPDVDFIIKMIDENHDVKEIRKTITDLIEHHLNLMKKSLGYWEKLHFANAIASLAWNINSRHQPNKIWLELCLSNVKKALVPYNQRDENHTPKEKQLEALTYEQLIEYIKSLRQKGCY